MKRVAIVSNQLTPLSVASRSVTIKDNTTGASKTITGDDAVTTSDIEHSVSTLLEPQKRGNAQDQRPISQGCVQFIGAPFADGQNLFGCELMPTAMRDAGIEQLLNKLGWGFSDDGDLSANDSNTSKLNDAIKRYREWVRSGTTQRYDEWVGEEIRGSEPVRVHRTGVDDPYATIRNALHIGRCNELLYEKVIEASSQRKFVLTAGGDHGIASATLCGLLQTYPSLAVVWVGAHADANTPETSPSNNYHGMAAAHALGWFTKPVKGFEWLRQSLPESRLVYIALRDVDHAESRRLQQSGVHIYTMADIDKVGIHQVLEMARSRVDPYNNRPFHLTFDIDAMDPVYAPGTGTLARGGLTYREAHYICEDLAATNRLVGMDIVEVNPLVDHLPERMHGDDPSLDPTSATVQLSVELALSALGKNILYSKVNKQVG